MYEMRKVSRKGAKAQRRRELGVGGVFVRWALLSVYLVALNTDTGRSAHLTVDGKRAKKARVLFVRG